MAKVTYDNRSFLVGGRRIWLVSGALHYFRMPSAMWADCLLRARRGGLNCIETYIAWNYHEAVEGEWDFSGDKDVIEFIQQAGDLGLYVIVRPGPYIGAEWDFGGLPAWLTAKEGMQPRSTNAAYTHYFDKYFRQILPRLADLQVSRGGNIIAVQNESGYVSTTMPDRLEYLEFVNKMIRRAGLDVPILTCNHMTEPKLPDTIECLRGRGRGVQRMRRLQAFQPEAPLVAAEYLTGRFDTWGDKHVADDPRRCARVALELMGAGAQVNYYMYHGGTNFGFWAGRTARGDHGFVATSYDCDAPISEGGGLTPKYYTLRLINMMAQYMGNVLAAATPMAAASALTDTATLSLSGSEGHVTVVTNNGNDKITTARVALNDGRAMEVDLSHFGAVAIFQDAVLTETHTLDYSNLMPLGVFGGRILLLHGVAGQRAVVSINGTRTELEVPDGDAPATFEVDELTVFVINSPVAERCWLVDGQLVFGPDFVGETLDELAMPPKRRDYSVVTAEGDVRKVRAPASVLKPHPKAPRLGQWKRVTVCGEPNEDARQFQALDAVAPMDHLGVPQGYGWYRVSLKFSRPTKKNIYLPCCEDQATVWVNGKRAGIWGRGHGASRDPMPIELARGVNELTFLLDDLGRLNRGYNLGGAKGIWGDMYAATPTKLKAWRLRAGAEKDFSQRIIPRNQLGLMPRLRSVPMTTCETSFSLSQPVPVHVRFEQFDRPVALFCNDHLVGFYADRQGGFGDVLIANEVKKGANRIRLLVWGDVTAKDLAAAVKVHRMDANLTAEATWRFRPWNPAPQPGRTEGKGLPVWYRTTFPAPSGTDPLFLTILQARKGQIFLNGHNAGRFWSIGPQSSYFLPTCWMQEVNEVLIFEQSGHPPTGSRLEFKPHGPNARK